MMMKYVRYYASLPYDKLTARYYCVQTAVVTRFLLEEVPYFSFTADALLGGPYHRRGRLNRPLMA